MQNTPIEAFDEDWIPIQCDANGLIKVTVDDIENLARKLKSIDMNKLGVLIHYVDSEGITRVWDGK